MLSPETSRSRTVRATRRAARTPHWGAVLLLSLLASCGSLSIQRDTETSGTFEATGWNFTIFKIDIPQTALNIARENASDARLPNAQVTEMKVVPNLGWFDWVFDIIGIRYARVEGTWGFDGE